MHILSGYKLLYFATMLIPPERSYSALIGFTTHPDRVLESLKSRDQEQEKKGHLQLLLTL
jgi:hypothetical protein